MDTSSPAPALRNPKAAEIPALLERLDRYGLSVAAFARSLGLKPAALYIAQQKRRAAKQPTPIFDPVRIIEPSSPAFEVTLQSGHRLCVPTDFDPDALRQLLAVLGAC